MSESEPGNNLRMDSCDKIKAVPSVKFDYRHVLVIEVSKIKCESSNDAWIPFSLGYELRLRQLR